MPGSKLLGAVAVRQEPSDLPEVRRAVVVVRVALDAARGELDDLVEERVRVDEEDVPPRAGEVGDEARGAAEADQGFVGVDDGHPVAGPVGVLLEMVLRGAAAEVGAGVEELLDYRRVERH